MAKKNKKISVSALEKAVAENCQMTETIEWNGLEIEIKKIISIDEMYAFVDQVTAACFDAETGAYVPKRKEFMIRAAVIELYTNLSLPTSVRNKYAMMYGTDLYTTVINHIDGEQLFDIIRAIDEGIGLLTNTGAAVVIKRMEDVVKGFEELGQNMSGVFEGVTGADMQKVVKAISENGFDEEKIIKAYLDVKEPTNDNLVSAV